MGLDRRTFLKASAAQAALLGAGVAGCSGRHPGAGPIARGDDPFQHGVASGDPLAARVILWTRVSPEAGRSAEPRTIEWWIARDAEGRDVIGEGSVEALPEHDYTVKVDAVGLSPATDYYYGFRADAHASPVGRTRTLPVGPVERLRLAFCSCSNYPQGYFNGYARMAERDDIEAVLHLGDYLYEYGNGEYGDGTALGRIPDPIHEIISLEDYRRRHATYKSDPDLQAVHARHPFIAVWDDHESANNAWMHGAENHDPERGEGDWETRRLAAIRAYYEWMPIRELPTGLFRRFRFGDLADLIMLDTRLAGRDEQGSNVDHARAEDPSRSLLGDEQEAWLLEALSESRSAGIGWRVIGQQVVFSRLTDGVAEDFNADAWDGYRASRRRVLSHLEDEGIDDVVFLTGDVHSAWAFDVPPPLGGARRYDGETGEGALAVECVTPAISSPPVGRNPRALEMFADLRERHPHLRWVDLEHNGYVVLELRPDRARAEWVFTDPTRERTAGERVAAVFETAAGANHLRRVDVDE